MSWVDDARRAWDEHQRREQERDEQDAARVIEHVEKLRERLGARPTAGTSRLGEQERAVLVDGTVRLMCTAGDSLPAGVLGIELRADVPPDNRPPVVHAWLNVQHRSPLGSGVPLQPQWIDRGPVETLADLGRALDPSVDPEPRPEPEASVGDMLYTVLQGLVREVVHQEYDGRLGDGPP